MTKTNPTNIVDASDFANDVDAVEAAIKQSLKRGDSVELVGSTEHDAELRALAQSRNVVDGVTEYCGVDGSEAWWTIRIAK